MRKSLLAAILLPLCLLGKPLNAEESQRHDLWIYFDPIVSTSDQIEINNFYESESSSQEKLDYIKSMAAFDGNTIYTGSSLPITSTQISEAGSILNNVKNGTLSSYSDLINSSKNLSEIQKLAMAAAISKSVYDFDYLADYNGEILSQEDFFKKLQEVLNYKKDTVGLCRHISANGATLLNDLGIRTSAVTGTNSGRKGHAYDISKLENATAVLDGGNIIIAQTKDIEKALEIYQFCSNSATFQHDLFGGEGSKLEYRLITKDGENYLYFTGYDFSTDTIKNALFNTLPEIMPLSVNLTEREYLSEKELNVYGIFVKTGEIRGNSMSPLEKISLSQTGYSGNFLSPQLPGFSVRPSLSLIYGDMQYKKDKGDPESKDILFGVSGNTIISYNQKERLNLSLRIGYNASFNMASTFFYDFPLEAGASFKFSNKNFVIEPYLISQFGILPLDFGTYVFAPQFTEFKTGVALTIPLTRDSTVSFDPYYSLKDYESGVGVDAKLKTRFAEFNLSVDASQHTYDFAPDRLGVGVSASFSLNNSKISVTYKNEIKDYDGEKTIDPSFSIDGTVKF